MLVGLSVPPDVTVDRFYRGAIVLLGTSTFALPEEAVVLLERARDARPASAVDEVDAELVEMLVQQGLLRRAEP